MLMAKQRRSSRAETNVVQKAKMLFVCRSSLRHDKTLEDWVLHFNDAPVDGDKRNFVPKLLKWPSDLKLKKLEDVLGIDGSGYVSQNHLEAMEREQEKLPPRWLRQRLILVAIDTYWYDREGKPRLVCLVGDEKWVVEFHPLNTKIDHRYRLVGLSTFR